MASSMLTMNCQHNRIAKMLYVAVALTTLVLISLRASLAFTVPPQAFRPAAVSNKNSPICRSVSTMTRSDEQKDSWGNTEEESADGTENNNDDDIDFLFEEPEIQYDDLDVMEKVWRHAKKPLLRIGSKGATHSHGNSLRQLLEDHTVVKVKVNTKKFGTLENAFETLRDLAEENGAQQGIELIQAREGDKTILFGMPGTLEKMKEGNFPPAPLTPPSPEDSTP